MVLSVREIQEIQKEIESSLKFFWKSIFSDKVALFDVIDDIFLQILENTNNKKPVNIDSLVLHTRRRCFAEKKKSKDFYRLIRENESILILQESPEIQPIDSISEPGLENFWVEVPELKLSPTQETGLYGVCYLKIVYGHG